MPAREPFPELSEILVSIGEAGSRIAAIGASEGGAGNISVCVGWPIEVRRQFPVAREIELPPCRTPSRRLADRRDRLRPAAA
jgi:rhamnulose-1-phosphate aldolase